MEIKKLLIVPDKKAVDICIDIAKQYNCGFEYNDFFMPNVLDSQEDIDKIISLYTDKSDIPEYCTFHGAFIDVTIFSQDQRIFEASDYRVEQSILIARKIGAKAIVFHTNYIPNFRQKAYRDSWVEINARYWSEKLRKYPDISIYIENMFDEDYELLLKLGENMSGVANFGLCFDYAHACVFGDENKIDEWCAKLAPYIKHIHINDNDFITDSHEALGKGKIDWKNFKKNYQMYFPEATVLVEMNGIDKIKASLEYLKAL